jgi:Tfp pilus assembly protein PilO
MAMRSDSSSAFKKSVQQISKQHNDINMIMDEIPEILSFSEYAVKVRSLIDRNQLFIEGSLVFSPGKVQNPFLLIYSTNIKVTGKYPDIKQLITDIQNLKGLKHINSISMTRSKKDKTKITFGFRLSVFLKKGTV